jgi:hypothetical protein
MKLITLVLEASTAAMLLFSVSVYIEFHKTLLGRHIVVITSVKALFANVNIQIHKTVILLVVLYGCETWSITLWEEHRLGCWRTGR